MRLVTSTLRLGQLASRPLIAGDSPTTGWKLSSTSNTPRPRGEDSSVSRNGRHRLRDLQSLSNRRVQGVSLVELRQWHEDDAIYRVRGELSRDALSEPRFAGAARAGQDQQPHSLPPPPLDNRSPFVFAANQTCQVRRGWRIEAILGPRSRATGSVDGSDRQATYQPRSRPLWYSVRRCIFLVTRWRVNQRRNRVAKGGLGQKPRVLTTSMAVRSGRREPQTTRNFTRL